MVQLNEEKKQYIIEFIKNNKPQPLPLIDIKAKKTLKINFNKVHNNEEDFVIYGSEGHYYTNAFCKINDKLYILTFNMENLISYADYKNDYEN